MLCKEKPPQSEALEPQLGSSPCSVQLEKSPDGNQDPEQPKINKYNILETISIPPFNLIQAKAIEFLF